MNKYIRHRIVHPGCHLETNVYELIVDNKIVGTIEQHIPHPETGATYRQITRLDVEEPFRGKGYGRELVEFFEEKARSQGENWIEVNSSESAKPFYEHLGFIKTPYGILRKLFRKIGINSGYYKPI